MNKPPLGCVKYILTFIDDLSRFTCVYLLNNKNIVFENFKEFRELVEKQHGWHRKCLRSENGRESVSR